jgi:hypothetical protein
MRDAVLMRMGDPRQAVHALDHLHDQSLVFLEQSLVLLVSLFIFQLQVDDELHALGQRLVAFCQLFEALINVHLPQWYI